MEKGIKVCSICGTIFKGYGNNAEPVNNGVCCDVCNFNVVVPRRLNDVMLAEQKEKLGLNKKKEGESK